MWVVPTSSELAGSKKSHPFFKPFTCLLLRKKRKDWEKKNHETKCFFAIKPGQIIWEALTPPKVFCVRANSKSKSLTRQLSLNFHKTRLERFLDIDLRTQDFSYFYIFFVIWFFLYGELVFIKCLLIFYHFLQMKHNLVSFHIFKNKF